MDSVLSLINNKTHIFVCSEEGWKELIWTQVSQPLQYLWSDQCSFSTAICYTPPNVAYRVLNVESHRPATVFKCKNQHFFSLYKNITHLKSKGICEMFQYIKLIATTQFYCHLLPKVIMFLLCLCVCSIIKLF